MATIYQRLQHYRLHPQAVVFSKKKLRNLYFMVASFWNKQEDRPELSYVDSQEDGQVFRVRIYPDNYTPTIDHCIWKIHAIMVKQLTRAPKVEDAKPAPPVVPAKPPRLRTRKPTPVFSGKPLIKNT